MQAAPEMLTYSEASLQLILFVDERPSSRQQLQEIHTFLDTLRAESAFELQIVEVGAEPYLAEHFRVVATPTLVKILPEPRQILAGSNLVDKLKNWWPRWQLSVQEYQTAQAQEMPLPSHDNSSTANTPKLAISSVAYSAELIQLSDEVFRLKKEKEELLEQLKFKDRVIALLAHDLRSPLTAASLAIDTLEIGQNSHTGKTYQLKPSLINHLLKQARTQIRVMDRMITDILQAARGTSAELRIHPHKLDIRIFCKDILAQMQERFKIKSQQLETDIPNDLPFVYADEERLRQVIVNLIENAIKYTPEGGKIHVSILHRTTQKIQVSVGDTGPGIPPENRERIFEDHFRLQRDQGIEGYGLGLALCQRIIRAHYGQIWVDSIPNQGSCFHFTLPVYLS